MNGPLASLQPNLGLRGEFLRRAEIRIFEEYLQAVEAKDWVLARHHLKRLELINEKICGPAVAPQNGAMAGSPAPGKVDEL